MKAKKNILLLAAACAALSGAARDPEPGYRGFIDWSNGFTSYTNGTTNKSQGTWFSGVQTSHGYQFTPYLYVGAGMGVEHSNHFNQYTVPVFLDARTDLRFDKYTPYADVRLGYNLVDGGGIYFSPTVGYRLNWGRKANFNVGIGMALRGYSVEMYDVTVDKDGGMTTHYGGKERRTKPMFALRLGFDF